MKNDKKIVTNPLRCIRPRKANLIFEGQILMVDMSHDDGMHIGPIQRYDFIKVLKVTNKQTFSSISAEVHCKVLKTFGLPDDYVYLNEYVVPIEDLIRQGYTLKPRVWRLLKCLHG